MGPKCQAPLAVSSCQCQEPGIPRVPLSAPSLGCEERSAPERLAYLRTQFMTRVPWRSRSSTPVAVRSDAAPETVALDGISVPLSLWRAPRALRSLANHRRDGEGRRTLMPMPKDIEIPATPLSGSRTGSESLVGLRWLLASPCWRTRKTRPPLAAAAGANATMSGETWKPDRTHHEPRYRYTCYLRRVSGKCDAPYVSQDALELDIRRILEAVALPTGFAEAVDAALAAYMGKEGRQVSQGDATQPRGATEPPQRDVRARQHPSDRVPSEVRGPGTIRERTSRRSARSPSWCVSGQCSPPWSKTGTR